MLPILIDHARMPGEAEVPPSLSRLTYRNAIDVDQGRDFHPHVDRLVRGIEYHLEQAKTGAGRSPSQSSVESADGSLCGTGAISERKPRRA